MASGDISVDNLLGALATKTDKTQDQLNAIASKEDSVNLGELLKMQFTVNQLSHFADASTNVLSAFHGAIMGMIRNFKG
jgi:hypothetical protein